MLTLKCWVIHITVCQESHSKVESAAVDILVDISNYNIPNTCK